MKTDGKTTKKSEENPLANSEREQKIAQAADFHTKRMKQKTDIDNQREFANKPAGNAEFEQAVSEDTNIKIDEKIAEAAFFIAKRRDFAPGDQQSDWLQAESNVEGVLKTELIERRNGSSNDRRNAANHDRRI